MGESTVLIVGASRGIGLELARQYVAAGWRVHATSRTPQAPGPLGACGAVVHRLDVTSRTEREALHAVMADEAIDVLIHNAGIMGEERDRARLMAINADAALATADALIDRVAAGRGKVAIMSSQLGARRGRTDTLGPYGDSKAALNDGFRERCEAWRELGVSAIVMHPGWVRTDMGGANAAIGVEESALGIRTVIENLGPPDHGRFLTWDGREHPW